MITSCDSIILNHVEFGLNYTQSCRVWTQFVSIVLDCSRLSRFFSIFLDYVEICMEYIFVVLVPGLFVSQIFSICLDYVEIFMDL